jgi:hypothetical protein
MRLKIERLTDGPGPQETIIRVLTADGESEEVVVHRPSIVVDSIDIGYPLHREEGRTFVELPQEAMSGRWRIWVPSTAIVG